jgi:hypothetical protein
MLERKLEHTAAVHHLFIDSETSYALVRRKLLYNILIEFGIRKKLVRVIIMRKGNLYLSSYRQNLSATFRIQSGLKQGDALNMLPVISKKIRRDLYRMEHTSSWTMLMMLISSENLKTVKRNKGALLE